MFLQEYNNHKLLAGGIAMRQGSVTDIVIEWGVAKGCVQGRGLFGDNTHVFDVADRPKIAKALEDEFAEYHASDEPGVIRITEIVMLSQDDVKVGFDETIFGCRHEYLFRLSPNSAEILSKCTLEEESRQSEAVELTAPRCKMR